MFARLLDKVWFTGEMVVVEDAISRSQDVWGVLLQRNVNSLAIGLMLAATQKNPSHLPSTTHQHICDGGSQKETSPVPS